MNKHDIYEAIENIDNHILKRSERTKKPWWIGLTAAALVIAIGLGTVFNSGQNPVVTTAYAISEANYPKMAKYPDENSPTFHDDYDKWWESIKEQERETDYKNGVQPFVEQTAQQFLSDTEQNKVYSPLNVYMALAMLAEITGSDSRQQILDLLSSDSIESLRAQANDIWNTHYMNDGATTSILASSLWLDDGVKFNQQVMDILAKNYYASSYKGDMSSSEFNEVFKAWLSEQTGGLLDDQIEGIKFTPDTIMALATTIYFRSKWYQEFEDTKADVFHGATSDTTCKFMNASKTGNYFWGNNFSATYHLLDNYGGTMYFILPDEGVGVDELLKDKEVMDFIFSQKDWENEWENKKEIIINLSVPKFDITSQIDLQKGLENLGVTDVFDSEKSDFSPVTDMKNTYIGKAQHDVRFAIDEKGVTAAAYTVMLKCGSGPPPDDEIDFVLDRPFLFTIISDDGLPLFIGVVNQL